MSKVLHLITDQAGERLDSFLSRQLPEKSRSYWQKLCANGNVTSAASELKGSHIVKAGEAVTVILPEQPDFSQQTLPLLYEDDDVLVINKPAGMLTHAKGALSDEFTVAEFIRPRTTDGVATNRPGIVHRLDRDTSGVIIAAKHAQAKHWLQKQFSERKVKKMYRALVESHLNKPQALLNLPIERNPKKPQTFRVGSNGKPASTTYQTESEFTHYTLVKLYPLTGRTHQLRVHMAYMGVPIVGDALYGKTDSALKRMFLHAAELEITLPNRVRKRFAAPLPKELQDYISSLQ